MAEEKGLYLVQMCKENHYFPKVIAAPSECRKEEQLAKNESLDFEQYCFDGNFIGHQMFVVRSHVSVKWWMLLFAQNNFS